MQFDNHCGLPHKVAGRLLCRIARTLPSYGVARPRQVRLPALRQRPRCGNLYELAVKYDWDERDVMAFLRCQQVPPKKMMRDLARELEVSLPDLEHILKR